MIRPPPNSTLDRSSAASDVYKRQLGNMPVTAQNVASLMHERVDAASRREQVDAAIALSLIHISEPTRPY